MRSSTHSLSSLVQFPIKFGIFPDNRLPSILLQAVKEDEKLSVQEYYTSKQSSRATSLTNQLSSLGFRMILV